MATGNGLTGGTIISTGTLTMSGSYTGNYTNIGTFTISDLLTVIGDGHLFLGATGETPKIDMLYTTSVNGLGWDTRIFTGKTDDLPNGQAFPTSTSAGGYGTQYQANSDGAFFGIIPYPSAVSTNYRPVINWGDDVTDTPFAFQFNGVDKATVSSAGVITAPTFVGALTGNATTASTLQTARTIAGVSFNGSANISLNNNAITNGAGYISSYTETDTLATVTARGASTGTSSTFGSTGVNTKLRVVNTTYYTSPTYTWTNSAIQTTSMEIIDATTDNANVCATLVMHNYGDGGVKFRMGNTGDKTLYFSSGQSQGAGNPTDDNSGTYFDEMRINNNIVYHAGNFTPGSYLPLAGGTMTGSINMGSNNITSIASGLSLTSYDLTSTVGLNLKVDSGNVSAITIDNVGSTTFSGYTYFPNYLFHSGDTNTRMQFGTGTITLRGDSGITLDGPTTVNENFTATGLSSFTKSNGPVVQITKTGSAPGNNTTLIVENTYANHSWGVVQEIRGGGITGTDRPALLFSSPLTTQSWTTGYYYTTDDFAITSNRGYRNGGWGTLSLRVTTAGDTIAVTSMQAPIFYDSLATAYYLDLGAGGISLYANGSVQGEYFVGSNYTSSGYTVYKGYDNWNHFISIRGYARPSQGKSDAAILGGHQTSFVEYAETGSATTGWFFMGSQSTNYVQVAKITQSHSEFVASVRSPLFYDNNNTGYYLDPAGSSILNVITTNGNVFNGNTTVSGNNYMTFGPNSTWGSSLRVGGNGRTATGTEMASIVTTDGNIHLDAANSSNAIYLNYYAGTGGTYFGTGAGGYVARVYSSGNAHFPIYYDYTNTTFYLDPASTGTSLNVAGDVVAYASSDIRFKNNVAPITNALDKLSKIGGYTFEWNEKSHKKTGKKDIGVIAQEVEEILPEIVDTRDNGYKAVDYSKLTALLIQSVKEQQVIIDNLKSRIETLENN